jgi:hypothetical protein
MALHRTSSPQSPVAFERMAFDPVRWDEIVAGYPEAEVFHSSAWLGFLAASQGAEPVVATIHVGDRLVGHFVGGIVRRYGLRILGSPLRGWGTQSMGFLLLPGADRTAAARALADFAFRDLGCHHLEFSDRALTAELMVDSAYRLEAGKTYVVDLESSEDEILNRMQGKTRQYIRKATRLGLKTEVTSDVAFADDFYAQLSEVFGRQGLAPTYPVERVRQLIEAVAPSQQLLLLRVRTPDGRIVGTGLAVGRNRIAVNWGAAWFRADAEMHPIQLFWWDALRYWKARGVLRYDMGGAGDYKERYGSILVPTAHFYLSRYPALRYGRALVRRLVRVRQIGSAVRHRRAASSGSPERSPGPDE